MADELIDNNPKMTATQPTALPESMKDLVFTQAPELMSNPAEQKITTELQDGTKLEVKTEKAAIESEKKEPVKEEEKKEVTPKEKEVKAGDEKKEVEKKEESKSEFEKFIKPPKKKEEEKIVEKGKEVIKQLTPKEKTDESFDYNGFTQQEVTNLKNMSKQSREYTANLIKQNKELSGLKDSTYLQHEQGYTLSPEYQDLSTRVHYGTKEAKIWKEQLLNIRAGKPYKNITGWDKQGNAVMSTEMAPTEEDDIRLSGNLNNCLSAVQQLQGQLGAIPQNFKQRIETDRSQAQEEMKARFAWVANPELLEHTIEIEGVGDRAIKDIKQDFINVFPVYERNSMGAEVAANLMVALQLQASMLRSATNTAQVAEIKQQEVARGEPNSNQKPTAEEEGGTFSLAGMPGR